MNEIWKLRNYYELLEIPRDASPTLIRDQRALQIRAWQHVVTPTNGVTERLQAINEAYEVLSNPAKRRRYDATLLPVDDVEDGTAFSDPHQRSAEVWKRMAAWMRDENVGAPFERKMAFTAGDYLERRRQPTAKQLDWMRRAWDAAISEGFDPSAEPDE